MFFRQAAMVIGMGLACVALGCSSKDDDKSGSTTCGDNAINGTDKCDGTQLGGASCMSLGYLSGVLGCTARCTYDTSDCVARPENCDNGALDTGEDCDGANLNGADCASQGFGGGGMLACSNVCRFDTSDCVETDCPNGSIDYYEECDGADLAGESCTSLGYSAGTLACNSECAYDFGGCTLDCTEDSYNPNSTAETAAALTLPFSGAGLVACGPGDEDWYSIELAASTIYEFTLTFTDADGDLDLELYDPTDLNFPVEYSAGEDVDTETFVVANTDPAPVAYLLAVSRYSSPVVSQTYTLAVSSVGAVECTDDSPCGARVCRQFRCVDRPQGDTCAAPIVVSALPFAATAVDYADFNADFEFPNTTCTSYATAGGEAFYELTLAAGDQIRVIVTPTGFDPAVYAVLPACDPAAACLGGVDVGETGDPETFDYTAAAAGTVLIGVDCYRSGAAGTYDIAISRL